MITSVTAQTRRNYAAKKPPALTESQLQFQKLTAELNFREKTSFRGTTFVINSVETSIAYMKSEGINFSLVFFLFFSF